MTNKEISSTTTAAKSEKNSEITLDTQEVLKETSSDNGALPLIDFDISIAPTEQGAPAALEELLKAQQKAFNAPAAALEESLKAQQKAFNAAANAAAQGITEIVSGTMKSIVSLISEKMSYDFDITATAKLIVKTMLSSVQESFEEARLYAEKLKPFIEKELKTAQKSHPEIENISPEDIANVSVISLLGADEAEIKALQRDYSDKDLILENIDIILDILRKAEEDFAASSNKDLLPQISPKKITEIKYPVDKVNSSLWELTINETVPLKAESDKDAKRGKHANIYVLLDFDELDGVKISRQLTSYDKLVFIAVANLKAQGHDTITAWQVYNTMGGVSRPKKDTIEKIIQSIETLSKCRVTIDNTEETQLYSRYDRVTATFPLLTTKICSGYANGKIVDNAITVSEVPYLLTFAEKRGQLTTVPLRLFRSPINKKEANLLLQDYLFTRIARMKNDPKMTKTILLEKVYQKCNVTTYKQKTRLPEKIERLLNFYKNECWITGFTITERSIEIKT